MVIIIIVSITAFTWMQQHFSWRRIYSLTWLTVNTISNMKIDFSKAEYLENVGLETPHNSCHIPVVFPHDLLFPPNRILVLWRWHWWLNIKPETILSTARTDQNNWVVKHQEYRRFYKGWMRSEFFNKKNNNKGCAICSACQGHIFSVI